MARTNRREPHSLFRKPKRNRAVKGMVRFGAIPPTDYDDLPFASWSEKFSVKPKSDSKRVDRKSVRKMKEINLYTGA